MSKYSISALAVLMATGLSSTARAQTTFTEDFTGTTTTNPWYYFNGACLTAGTGAGTGTQRTVAGFVPSCWNIRTSYYGAQQDNDAALVGGANGVAGNGMTLPDPAGQGALRFTNGSPYGHGENGAIVSAAAFNAGQGVQITFKTVTYRGDSGGAGGDGADGMSFYLIDATQFPTNNPTSSSSWNGIGSWGGSLGYTCSNANPPYDGLVGGYLAIGIDEFGNFLNGTTLEPGFTGATATGDNTALGFGYVPGRIGLRGGGSISWAYLNNTYPADYPSTLTATQKQGAVQNTCKTGTLWNYAAPAAPVNTNNAIADYAPILSSTSPLTGAYSIVTGAIANEGAMSRPTGLTNPAGVTNGNVILYNLKITQNGLLSFSYSFNGTGVFTPVVTNQSIAASNGLLPASLLFGFAGSTGGDTNIHEILCFKAVPINQSTSSAAGNQKQTSEVQTTSQAYFAYYNPNDWTGRLAAYGLADANGILTLQANSTWDAQCNLTGVASGTTCLTNQVTGPTAPQAPANRVMMTLNTIDATTPLGTGIPFEWPGTSGLTAAEQTVIDNGDATPHNGNRVNYLRGDRTNELKSTGVGLFRARDGVLGDIIDSSPVWVGPPNSPYVLTWRDNLFTTATMPENATSYLTFQTAQQSRLNVVYVGANDGFLHGFESGTEDLVGNVSLTNNDGKEVLAYMPGVVLNNIHKFSSNATTEAQDVQIDYANPQYAHSFFIDATPGSGDLFYAGAWHTWMVGGLGAGGAAIYALDITNPTSGAASFTEAHAAAVIKGEWSSGTITCIVAGAASTACRASLGNTYGTPQIRRFHNGSWGAVFGNGYGSTNGDAGIFVMLVNPTSGAVTFYYLSAGNGSGNGIAYASPADLDGDHITDYVYAGDLKGNVWRFDLTSNNPANWALSSTGQPLFKTLTGQPITTPLVLASAVVTGSTPQIMVAFGTGQRTQFTNTTPVSYISGTQSLYGVWDWNLSGWNAKSTAQYTSLTTAQVAAGPLSVATPYTLGRTNLQAQTFTSGASGIDVSNTTITWAKCGGTCTAGKFGWYADLISNNGATTGVGGTGAQITEQIVSAPSLFESALIVNSTTPSSNSPLSCSAPTTDTGVLYVISVLTGGTFSSAATGGGTSFASAFVNFHDALLGGLQTNETGAVTVLTTLEATNFVLGQDIAVPTPGSAAPGTLTQIQLPLNTNTARMTWIELR
ncbi:MAG TPA: PilC/PilY family type IV pilus protein [Steroidobacteraceae bacterium]